MLTALMVINFAVPAVTVFMSASGLVEEVKGGEGWERKQDERVSIKFALMYVPKYTI